MAKIVLASAAYTADEGKERIPMLSIYSRESTIGTRTLQYRMCSAHLNKQAADSNATPRGTRLDNTAFVIQYSTDKTLRAVMNSEDVFMSFKMSSSTVACRAYLERNKIIVSYKNAIPRDNVSLIIPVAMLAICANSACRDAYLNCMGTPSIESIYRFCDTVMYEFIDKHPENEYDNKLSLEEMKQAVRAGQYGEFPFLESPVKETSRKRKAVQEQIETQEPKPQIDEYRNGSHIIQHEWDKDQKTRIIPLNFLDTFVPIPEFFRLMHKLDYRIGKNMVGQYECGLTEPEEIRRDVVNLLLYGNPGTGKTVLAHALSAATGMPLYEVKFDKYTESDEIEGKNKIIDGKLSFTQTDFLEGYEKGGIILLEEINCADQNVITGSLNNAIEYPFFITKNGYEKVKRNPFTVLIATMNVGTEGTMWLNQSFASRFKQKYRISDPTKEDFISFLTNYGYERDAAIYVHDAYEKVVALLNSSRATAEYALNLSTRACLGALENMVEGDDPKTALMDTIVGSIGIVDPKTAENISKNVIANLPEFNGKV